jgi:hypothetical protein
MSTSRHEIILGSLPAQSCSNTLRHTNVSPVAILRLSLVVALATASWVAHATCPQGSQFFGYGGSYGCIQPGSNTIIARCFGPLKTCPTGWFQGGVLDGQQYCCPPPPRPDPTVTRACYWAGTAPLCDGRCRPGELGAEIAENDAQALHDKQHFGADCLHGHKVYCCEKAF